VAEVIAGGGNLSAFRKKGKDQEEPARGSTGQSSTGQLGKLPLWGIIGGPKGVGSHQSSGEEQTRPFKSGGRGHLRQGAGRDEELLKHTPLKGVGIPTRHRDQNKGGKSRYSLQRGWVGSGRRNGVPHNLGREKFGSRLVKPVGTHTIQRVRLTSRRKLVQGKVFKKGAGLRLLKVGWFDNP